jgi:hypothetical protein
LEVLVEQLLKPFNVPQGPWQSFALTAEMPAVRTSFSVGSQASAGAR